MAFLVVFAVVGGIFFIIGIKMYYDCINGKVAVYINETEKKKYQRIK